MDTINKIIENGQEIEPVYKEKRGIVLLWEVDNLMFVSGHGPEDQITGEPLFRGRIGKELTPEEGCTAARKCGIIILGALKDTPGSLDRAERVVRAFGLVNCGEGFRDAEHVMDGFSDVIADVLEERGYHARTTMDTHNLPNSNIPVGIEVIMSVRPQKAGTGRGRRKVLGRCFRLQQGQNRRFAVFLF